jgi:glutamate-1-semialdehyde 2,1-aminomutase
MTSRTGIDPGRAAALYARERVRFAKAHPGSGELFARGKDHYLYGAPLHWMRRWAGGWPIYVERAAGTRLVDVDGHDYVDFCLGDTGAMTGHGNPAIADAVHRQLLAGASMMLPTRDAEWLGAELAGRFGLPFWNLATSATDADRFCIRLSRMITGRDKVLVFSGCYHGSVEEAHVELRDGQIALRNDIHPNGFDHARLSKVVEFNDVAALAAALADRDVACVLAEPAMTNCGMVPAAPGFHDALRRLTREAGTVLIIDETHTISSGVGGYTREHGLEPDMFVLGKAVGGGIPCAVYGMSREIAQRVWQALPPVDPAIKQSANAGFGGTLAGNAVTVAAMRATLEHVLTETAYRGMIALAAQLERDVRDRIAAAGLPWHVSRIGARVEYMFSPTAPRNGGEARQARDGALEALLHLYFLNRGVLLTPFHNMVLLCPASAEADIAWHDAVFEEFVDEVTAAG